MFKCKGISCLQILDKGSRTVYGKEYEKMYNPMWNLFGDFKYPPGTYYRVESKLYNPCWFMLDQLIISQTMIPLMVKEQNVEKVYYILIIGTLIVI